MERKLPIIELHGTTFHVDVNRQQLIECANPSNRISFLEMEDCGTHYTLKYDAEEKNISRLIEEGVLMEVPPMADLDPVGMADWLGVDIHALKGKTDFELIVNQDLIQRRKTGELPVFEIADHSYLVDLGLDCLRPKDDLTIPEIRFKDIRRYYIDAIQTYQVDYDLKIKRALDIDYRTLTEIPKHLIYVEIPHLASLDPIGFARRYGLNENVSLRISPPAERLKAKIIPWSETLVPQIISKHNKNSIKPKQKKGKKL